jgi:hypothetical protein
MSPSSHEAIFAEECGISRSLVDMAIFNTKGKDRHVFRGAGGAICVTDGTRRRGLHGIDVWVGRLFGLTGCDSRGDPR